MPNFRTFIYSHNVFQGFTRKIDLDYVESIDDIIKKLHNELITYLQHEKLKTLIRKVDIKRLHIHDFTFGDILISEPEKVFYVCDHQ
jgi:predicted translin family RNA/ssDNA-binding protein